LQGFLHDIASSDADAAARASKRRLRRRAKQQRLRFCRADMINPIQRSFELAAERCADMAPLVYRRLFYALPEMEPMFARDAGGHIKGSMLAFAIDAILDLAGPRNGTFRMIACEAQSHEAYGTSPKLFFAFFGVIVETMRELLAADWSAEFDEAWRMLLVEIEDVIAQDTATT
jgi:hemoglobin-like flavoprotein